jgi:uncharacterized membrane protein
MGEISESMALLAIAGMALVTMATRVAGVAIMRFVPITPRVEAFLRALASSVLVALVTPALLRGEVAAAGAVGVAGLVMALTRQAVLAMLAGVLFAALWRQWAG